MFKRKLMIKYTLLHSNEHVFCILSSTIEICSCIDNQNHVIREPDYRIQIMKFEHSHRSGNRDQMKSKQIQDVMYPHKRDI